MLTNNLNFAIKNNYKATLLWAGTCIKQELRFCFRDLEDIAVHEILEQT